MSSISINKSVRSSKTIKSIKSISKKNVLGFVLTLFRFLKEKDMCYLSGSIVFEDDNNKLFNLLTYGYLDNTSDICIPDVALPYPHITITHKEVFKKPDVNVVKRDEECLKLKMLQRSLKSSIRGCQDGICYKLELVFKKPILYLCGNDGNEDNMSPKQIILYYRFEYKGKKYLFFKLEAHPINSISHMQDYLSQARRDTYVQRRENNTIYDIDLKNKDRDFYLDYLKNLSGLSDKIIIYFKTINYDKSLRTGRELFIFEELKEYLIDKLLPFYLRQFKKNELSL